MTAQSRVAARVGSKTLSLSNLDKVLWPRDGYTKGDLIEYYQRVAATVVPHLKGRPLTLQRYPNGIDAPAFFEKQLPRGTPDWIDRVTVPTPGGSRSETTFVVCNDAPSLVYLANLGSIVLHVWTSRLPALGPSDCGLPTEGGIRSGRNNSAPPVLQTLGPRAPGRCRRLSRA